MTNRRRFLRSASLILAMLLCIAAFMGCTKADNPPHHAAEPPLNTQAPADGFNEPTAAPEQTTAKIPTVYDYNGTDAWIQVNDGQPFFTDEEKSSTEPFELYSELDELGRCGVAYANICTELMPTEKRGDIGSVKPTGWHTATYPELISDRYLYNRCHLIGFQLAGENANKLNLITGTRYLNIDGMLPFENMVADYVKETGNHVLYRVTPVFAGENLVADGVLMEAWSVEDGGDGVCFNAFAFNVQPGIAIDYATGDSSAIGKPPSNTTGDFLDDIDESNYVLNTGTMKFHRPDCSSAAKISENNYAESFETRAELIAHGYEPCGACKP